MWLNFPSFWCLIGDDYEMLKKVAIYTTLVILGLAGRMQADGQEYQLLANIGTYEIWRMKK